MKLNPNSARTWTNKAAVLHMLNRHDDAAAALDKALQIDPSFEPARRLRRIIGMHRHRKQIKKG